MSDPRLNSVHLDPLRRDQFRRAREALLDARGLHTLAVERQQGPFAPGTSGTMVQKPADQAPTSSEYWLVDQDSIYPLKIGVNTIGRLPDNDIIVQGPYVSRRHCAILVHVGSGCELYDVASKNGTYLNGQRLGGPTPLTSGDEIRMCDRQLVFMAHESAREERGHASTQVE